MFREYSKLCDGAFPDSLDFMTTTTIAGKKASLRMMTQNFWENLAPAKGKPNEVQRRKLEELMLKVIEGKLNEEQIKEIAEQMEEFIETHGLKTAEVGEAQPQETEEFGQAQINEILQRVQRGLNFAIQTSAERRRALRGQRRFVWRGRHADLLVSAKGLEELSSHLCRSFGP